MDGENNGSKPYFLMDDLGVPLFFWKHPFSSEVYINYHCYTQNIPNWREIFWKKHLEQVYYESMKGETPPTSHPRKMEVFAINDFWLVVEPTHPKNISQIGKSYPNRGWT